MPSVKTLPPTLPHGRKLADFKPLLPAEQKLLEAVAVGEMCWLCDEDDPQRPDIFTEQNEIRAPFIRFLALGGDDEVFVHEKGVQVAGAFIGGVLDLTNCQKVRSLLIVFSHFTKVFLLDHANLKFLNLSNSLFPALLADGMKCENNLDFTNVNATGLISLNGAFVDGDIVFNSVTLKRNKESPDPTVLVLNSATILGNLSFTKKAKIDGLVSCTDLTIGKNFVCENSLFKNELGHSFQAEQIKINGSFIVRKDCQITGGGQFSAAVIDKNIIFQSSHFQALSFESAKIGGNILLSNNFRAEGEVRFKNASIGGDFICENDSSIKHPRNTDNPKGHALDCGGIRVGGNVLLRDTAEDDSKLEINGSVNFMDARIGKGFECSHIEISHFVPSDKGSEIAAYALNLQGANIGGILTMKKADIYGSISLLKAHADSLNDDEASWPQPAIAQKSGIIRKIKDFFGAVSDRFKAKPQNRTAILNEKKAEPEKQEEEKEEKDSLQSVESDDSKPSAPPEYDVSRPQNHGALASVLSLDGFTYNQFAGNAPTKAETRLKWLMLQNPSALWTNFRPQPFEQLTKVLRKTGYEEQATQLLIHKYDHKQDVRIAQAKGFFASLWAWLLSLFFSFFLGLLTGYGKRPARVFGLLLTLWASSAFWYSQAAQQDVFAPSHPLIFLKYDQKPDCRINWVHCIENANPNHNPEFQAYTVFSPLLYSLDVMLPILNLHQEGDWGPKMKALKILGLNMPPASTWFVMWSQIILGWLGSFMLIAMLSGWMQKE